MMEVLREVLIKYGRPRKIESVRQPEDVAEFCRRVAPDNSREHVFALYFDGARRPIGWSLISTGSANASQIHPREIFQRAFMLGACSIALAHNHPSGELTPSRDDISVTKRIKQAGDTMGIELLDHVVFADVGCTSLREMGEL